MSSATEFFKINLEQKLKKRKSQQEKKRKEGRHVSLLIQMFYVVKRYKMTSKRLKTRKGCHPLSTYTFTFVLLLSFLFLLSSMSRRRKASSFFLSPTQPERKVLMTRVTKDEFRSIVHESFNSHSRLMPSFMIVGEAKCGTTMLWHAIVDNAKNFQEPRRKEICTALFTRYYDSIEDILLNQNDIQRISFKYALEFPVQSGKNGFTAEACTFYLSDYLAAQRLHTAFPWLKIIILVREPALRYLSNFNHALKRRKIKVNAATNLTSLFESLVTNEIDIYNSGDCTVDAKFGGPFKKDAQFNCLSLKRGFYLEHIKTYERYFGANNVKVVLYDDLNQTKSMHSIFSFLGTSSKLEEMKLKIVNEASKDKIYTLKSSDAKTILAQLREFYRLHNVALFKHLQIPYRSTW